MSLIKRIKDQAVVFALDNLTAPKLAWLGRFFWPAIIVIGLTLCITAAYVIVGGIQHVAADFERESAGWTDVQWRQAYLEAFFALIAVVALKSTGCTCGKGK